MVVFTDANRLAQLKQDYYQNVPSSCVGDCSQCIDLGDGIPDFTYFSGDILFIGEFLNFFFIDFHQ